MAFDETLRCLCTRRRKAGKKKALRRRTTRRNLPQFILPALAQLVSQPPEGDHWYHETKFDGYRTQAHLENDQASLYTRSGLDWTKKYPRIAAALEELPVKNAILDGEIVWLDNDGRSNFQKLQNSLQENDSQHLLYYVFDLLYHNDEDCRELPLHERKARLEKILKLSKHSLIRYSDHIVGHAQAFFKAACAYKLEGVISKNKDSVYRSKRSPQWLKSKCKMHQEFVIGGFTKGEGSRSEFGALLLGTYEGDQLRYVGRVGTGFTEKSLDMVRKKLLQRVRKQSPFTIKSPHGKNILWVKPDLVAEVTFGNWTDEGILRAGVFNGLREDKAAKDILREAVNVIKPSRSGKKNLKPLAISSSEKVLFAKEGITKLQIATYYQDIADLILPHLADRPLAFYRCPEGTHSKCFFQKHIAGKVPEDLTPVTIHERSGPKSYLTLNSQEGLLALSQMDAFELHTWGCRAENLEHPDQIVIDFDPGPGIAWRQVVTAAQELKVLLEELNLKSYVKVTGGKGLHVQFPIAPIYGWDQVKAFAKTLGYEMMSRHPDLYTVTLAKKARDKKIFIDYLRNGRGATAVVPYSLRAQGLSSVAMPVSWEDLADLEGSNIFTLEAAYKHLHKRKKDPWRDYFKKQQEITILKAVPDAGA